MRAGCIARSPARGLVHSIFTSGTEINFAVNLCFSVLWIIERFFFFFFFLQERCVASGSGKNIFDCCPSQKWPSLFNFVCLCFYRGQNHSALAYYGQLLCCCAGGPLQLCPEAAFSEQWDPNFLSCCRRYPESLVYKESRGKTKRCFPKKYSL